MSLARARAWPATVSLHRALSLVSFRSDAEMRRAEKRACVLFLCRFDGGGGGDGGEESARDKDGERHSQAHDDKCPTEDEVKSSRDTTYTGCAGARDS